MILCVLLSAGLSSRFGSPKALARLNQKTAIEHIQETLLSVRIEEIVVVLGHDAEKIKPFVFKHKKIKVVHNKNHKLGQTSSLKAGLKEASPDATGLMLLPVDYPFIHPQTLTRLIEFFEKEQPMFLVPTYHGKRGHPLLFRREAQKLFLATGDSMGANAVIHQNDTQTTLLAVDDAGVTATFNTPEELEQIRKRSKRTSTV